MTNQSVSGSVERGASRRALRRRFYTLSLLDRYLWEGQASLSPRFEERQRVSEALMEVDGFTEPRPPEPAPVLEAHDLTSFLEASHHYRRPVILRGFAAQMNAVKRWDEAYLVDALRGAQASVCVQNAEVKRRSWDVTVPMIEMDLAEYIGRMKDEDLYLNNSTEVLKQAPSLEADIDFTKVRQLGEPGAGWDEFIVNTVFISGPKVFSSLHGAIGGNFFLQITGRKKWTMIDPTYAPHVHAIPARPFQVFLSAYGGSHLMGRQGLEQEHIFTRLPRYEFTLEPGDLLYNAPWWMHEVSNLDPLNVGCALRHFTPPYRIPPSFMNNPVYGLSSVFPAAYAASIAHWMAYKVFGYKTPLRDVLEGLHHRLTRKLREKSLG